MKKIFTKYAFKNREEFSEFKEYIQQFPDKKCLFQKAKQIDDYIELNLICNDQYIGEIKLYSKTAYLTLYSSKSGRLERRIASFINKHSSKNSNHK